MKDREELVFFCVHREWLGCAWGLPDKCNIYLAPDEVIRATGLTMLNQEFMQALLVNFRHQGKKAIEKVARNQPAVYLKILALLVIPRSWRESASRGKAECHRLRGRDLTV